LFCHLRSILEAKAKLYEKMTTEALEHDEHEHPVLAQSLVNFTQKALDSIKEQKLSSHNRPAGFKSAGANLPFDDKEEEEEESTPFNTPFPLDEEEWTEFTDGLGRTRRCLKSDLPSFLSRNNSDVGELGRPKNPEGVSLAPEAQGFSTEAKRQKWEQEAETTAAKEKVHYQDVLYDGKRRREFYLFILILLLGKVNVDRNLSG
jgi:hypothetical protein